MPTTAETLGHQVVKMHSFRFIGNFTTWCSPKNHSAKESEKPDIGRINGKGRFIRVSPEKRRMRLGRGEFSPFLVMCHRRNAGNHGVTKQRMVRICLKMHHHFFVLLPDGDTPFGFFISVVRG